VLCVQATGLFHQVVREYASKDVRFGIECRDAVLGGVNKLADAVQVTLGPKVRSPGVRVSGICGRRHPSAGAPAAFAGSQCDD
jgi:hypothetical protein